MHLQCTMANEKREDQPRRQVIPIPLVARRSSKIIHDTPHVSIRIHKSLCGNIQHSTYIRIHVHICIRYTRTSPICIYAYTCSYKQPAGCVYKSEGRRLQVRVLCTCNLVMSMSMYIYATCHMPVHGTRYTVHVHVHRT